MGNYVWIMVAAVLAAAVVAALPLVGKGAPVPAHARYSSLDGLRGYLAFFVFLHHSAYWYDHSHHIKPDDMQKGFIHLGHASIALFFMITAFLFTLRVIEGRQKPVDWVRLYVSRVFRLAPLYLAVILVLLVIVGVLSGFALAVPLPSLVKSAAVWLSFCFLGMPDVNAVDHTKLIVAASTWSLPYEWLFYLVLPLLGLAFGTVPPKRYLALGALALASTWVWRPEPYLVLTFLGGVAAAMLSRSDRVKSAVSGRAGSLAALACVAAAVGFFPRGDRLLPTVLYAAAFAIIACGNDIFGILGSSVSRWIGQMGYSLYLVHGLLLFVVFRFILGPARAESLSELQHWSVILAVAPVLVWICSLSFLWIEQPGMKAGGEVYWWMRRRWPGSLVRSPEAPAKVPPRSPTAGVKSL